MGKRVGSRGVGERGMGEEDGRAGGMVGQGGCGVRTFVRSYVRTYVRTQAQLCGLCRPSPVGCEPVNRSSVLLHWLLAQGVVGGLSGEAGWKYVRHGYVGESWVGEEDGRAEEMVGKGGGVARTYVRT